LDHKKETKRKNNSDVTTGVKYAVASLLGWSKTISNLETGIMRLKGITRIRG
jgi:hypothetical protein